MKKDNLEIRLPILQVGNEENAQHIVYDTLELYKSAIVHFRDKRYSKYYRELYLYCESHGLNQIEAYKNVAIYQDWKKNNTSTFGNVGW